MVGDTEDKSMAAQTTLKSAKKELRSLMKQKLGLTSQDSISSQSVTVFRNLQNLKLYQDSKRIGIYLSMPTGELQTDSIVRHALGAGKQVFVPYLHKVQEPSSDKIKSVMDMVNLKSLSDYEGLKRDSWGIPTTEKHTLKEREHTLVKGGEGLDLILLPGVAFDTDPDTGFVRRLGHGKGFYDYFLHRYRGLFGSQVSEPCRDSGTGVLLYGLALEEQLLSGDTGLSVPVGDHDSLLHGLLVGNGTLLKGPEKE